MVKVAGRVSIVLCTLLGLLALQGVASADTTIVDPNDVLETQGISPETMIQDCWDEYGPDADLHSISYKIFKKNGHTYNIYLDIYIPPSFVPSIYPTAVVVHGGGFVGGCRRWNNFLSRQLADDGFVVFNIDYRLACDPEENPGVYLCGFNFAVGPTDVKDAIHWVRTHGGIYGAITSKLAAVGTSAGGTLSRWPETPGWPGTPSPR